MSVSLTSVAVYCGSSPGADPGFTAAAAALGRSLARRGIRVIYGGGHVGLMGVLADAARSEGGEVHGVITRALEAKEIAHPSLTSLKVVETMHERKAAMADLADGFVMMPGGFGTLDEFFEVVTWTQLGVHAKPCGILNVNGFFDPLLAQLAQAAEQRFLRADHRSLVIVEQDPDRLIGRLGSWVPVVVDKWLDRSER
ncbi:MAG TPA: TIGR00730 family Rossman fold protein [Streptosporangiaceae bacterium]